MGWLAAADIADLPGDGVVGRTCAGHAVAIYRVGDAFHATANRCTHGNALLSEGEVIEGFIECPLHGGFFEIATGRAQGAPVTRDLATYPVRVVDGTIEVEIAGEAT